LNRLFLLWLVIVQIGCISTKIDELIVDADFTFDALTAGGMKVIPFADHCDQSDLKSLPEERFELAKIFQVGLTDARSEFKDVVKAPLAIETPFEARFAKALTCGESFSPESAKELEEKKPRYWITPSIASEKTSKSQSVQEQEDSKGKTYNFSASRSLTLQVAVYDVVEQKQVWYGRIAGSNTAVNSIDYNEPKNLVEWIFKDLEPKDQHPDYPSRSEVISELAENIAWNFPLSTEAE
jgi:hypothetical protein